MSTSPEDQLVNALSHWLARHVDDDELRREVDAVDVAQLDPAQREAVDELREELAEPDGDDLEQQQRFLVRGLEVVEDKQERLLRRLRAKRIGHCLEEQEARAVVIGTGIG